MLKHFRRYIILTHKRQSSCNSQRSLRSSQAEGYDAREDFERYDEEEYEEEEEEDIVPTRRRRSSSELE